MARRYMRDNRGRFASVGATARGGRLATASGNKRATVKGKIKGAVPAGTISSGRRSTKPVVTPKPAASRQRVRGNFRPQNTMAKPKIDHGNFVDAPRAMMRGTPERKAIVIQNAKEMQRLLTNSKTAGSVEIVRSNPGYSASFGIKSSGSSLYRINPQAPEYAAPRRNARANRRTGFFSSGSAMSTYHHEVGHAKHESRTRALSNKTGNKPAPRVASRVSKYATTNRAEFAAETYAGRRLGHKYDHQVMRAYRKEMGLPTRNVRSQLKKKK